MTATNTTLLEELAREVLVLRVRTDEPAGAPGYGGSYPAGRCDRHTGAAAIVAASEEHSPILSVKVSFRTDPSTFASFPVSEPDGMSADGHHHTPSAQGALPYRPGPELGVRDLACCGLRREPK